MGKTHRNIKRNPRRIGKRKHMLEDEQNKLWIDNRNNFKDNTADPNDDEEDENVFKI